MDVKNCKMRNFEGKCNINGYKHCGEMTNCFVRKYMKMTVSDVLYKEFIKDLKQLLAERFKICNKFYNLGTMIEEKIEQIESKLGELNNA